MANHQNSMHCCRIATHWHILLPNHTPLILLYTVTFYHLYVNLIFFLLWFNVVHYSSTFLIYCNPYPSWKFLFFWCTYVHYINHSTTGDSLLTGNGPKWFHTRHMLTPAFHFDVLKPYVKVYCECVDVLLVSSWLQCMCPIFVDMYLQEHTCSCQAI